MRYVKYVLLCLILIPLNTFAIEMYCDKNVNAGENFKCIVSSSSNSLYSLSGTFDYDDSITIAKVNFLKGYQGTYGDKILQVDGPGYNASSTIVELTFKAPLISTDKSFRLSFNNIKYKYLSTDVNDRVVDNSLISTVMVKGDATKTTEALKKWYLVIKPNVSENISSVSENCNVDETGTCTINLDSLKKEENDKYLLKGYSKEIECTNLITGSITLSNDEIIYACYELKEEEPTQENKLRLLSLEIEEISNFGFNPNIYEYDIYVDSNINVLTIHPMGETSDVIFGYSGNYDDLQDGVNVIKIDLFKDGEKATYTLNVYKGNANNTKPYMSAININNYNLNFDNNIYEYRITLKYNEDKLEIVPIVEDEFDYTIIGNENLQDGSVIQIIIGDGENTTTYSIKIDKPLIVEKKTLYIYGAGFFIFCIIVYFVVKNTIMKDANNNNKKIKQNKKKDKKNKGEKIEKL